MSSSKNLPGGPGTRRAHGAGAPGGPGIAAGLISGAPQLGAGAVAGSVASLAIGRCGGGRPRARGRACGHRRCHRCHP